jgi:hypothetical protein
MILTIGARGHMVRDWNFADSQIRKFKGRVAETREVRGHDMITVVHQRERHESLI